MSVVIPLSFKFAKNYISTGTQIAPFLPIKVTSSVFQNIYGVLLFLFRLPFFLCLSISYFLVFQWLPIGSLVRKAWLWSILLSLGVWWVDLQVEGVKKGYVSFPLTSKKEGERENQLTSLTAAPLPKKLTGSPNPTP